MMDETLKAAVQKAIEPNAIPKGVNRPDMAARLDKITDLLEQTKNEIDDVRRTLSIIQKSMGDL